MLLAIDQVLTQDDLRHFRATLADASWQDGANTAGSLARSVKHNQQLEDGAEPALSLGEIVLRRLAGHAHFISAALPKKIHPPKFNRYAQGGSYGLHVDSAIMALPGGRSLRSDLSATLFLAEPEDYDGGELEIEGPFGVQAVKLAAGNMVLYPSTSLHRVTPVTRGARIAAFFWIESMVRDEGERSLLFDLDQSIQSLTPRTTADDPSLLKLTGVYHNLLRRWGDA